MPAMVKAGCISPGLGNGEDGPGDDGDCVSLGPAIVSMVGTLPFRLCLEFRWEDDSILSRRKPTVRGAGASDGAAKDGVGEVAALRSVCVFGFDRALIGDAGREVIGGMGGVAAELLVVGRACGKRGAVDIVDPGLEETTAGLAGASGVPLA